MQSIKQRIPDGKVLEQQLDSVLSSNLPDFLKSTHTKREEVVANIKLTVISFFLAIAIIFAIYFIQDSYGNGWVTQILMGCSMIWLVVVLLSGRQWLSNSRLLAEEMNMALVPIFSSTLNRALIYTHDEEHREETKRLLAESQLMTVEGKIEVEADDMYTVFNGHDVSVRELLVASVTKGESGKLDSKTVLFKGVLVVTKLEREHAAETFISTEGDRRGFAHQTFWSELLKTTSVQETIFEWNEFEKHLHVATSDPTAARELITTGFMQDLYDWWYEHKLNIRIAFKGHNMYMLLPEASIRIAASTTSVKPQAIKRYTWSLLRPIWRSLVLVEGVSR